MKKVDLDRRRTVALIGHNGSGKSHILSVILKKRGLVERSGPKSVDYDPIEQDKGSSISSHVATFEWEDGRVTVIDTPGFGDFVGEVINSVFVSENVVVVLNATAGVEIQTERFWRIADEMGKPMMVFVNQMDKERADFEKCLEDLKSRFEKKIVPIQVPIGSQADFKGVVDVFSGKAYIYENGQAVESEIPESVASKVEELKLSSIEDIVELDDELMERYLEGEEIPLEKILEVLKKGYVEGSIVPVLVGSAEKDIGIDLLIKAIFDIGASPGDSKPYVAELESGETV